jgi:hypothetical protein
MQVASRPSLADGLAVAEVGQLCLEICKSVVDEVILVDEPDIARSVLKLLELEKTVVEGAGAVPLAVAMKSADYGLTGKKVVLCLCGGNIDTTVLGRVIDRGLAADGRLCRFVACPDVVKNARRTLECFRHWQPRLAKWPVAFVCQDGQEHLDIPWDNCAAVFIGGSTDWKMSEHAAAIVKASKVIGKWCHVGRINTPGRLDYFTDLGADSCDGTGLVQYSHMRKKIYEQHNAPALAL